jgi:hypothetical protein
MYSLIRSISRKSLILEQVPALIVSITLAEMFYKFHSFTLETLAFLTTWFVIDALIRFSVRLLGPKLTQGVRQ